MSFKDDFVEALRSVKRDFFKESENGESPQPEVAASPSDVGQFEADRPSEVIPTLQEAEKPEPTSPPEELRQVAEPKHSQESEPAQGASENFDEIGASVAGDATPFKRYDSDIPLVSGDDDLYGGNGNGRYIDFEDSGVYDDNKTIISKNTVIRGALQTEDSIRLLGQVMGDIECKSNIVVAGKVRGNTTAANAYIYDAQVDGDVRCEDVVTVSNDAWVLGNIRAQQAEIDGKIKGNMEIRHMVSIGSSSSILGDISTDELEIKRGAFVNGQIMMYSPSRDVIDRFDRFDDQ